jgi:hypothetical protein
MPLHGRHNEELYHHHSNNTRTASRLWILGIEMKRTNARFSRYLRREPLRAHPPFAPHQTQDASRHQDSPSSSFDRHSTSKASRPQLQAALKSVNTGASLLLNPNCAHRCARDVAEMITSLPQWL